MKKSLIIIGLGVLIGLMFISPAVGAIIFFLLFFLLNPFSIVAIFVLIYVVNRLRRKSILNLHTDPTHEISPPDDLRPVEIGFLHDLRFRSKDMVSVLFSLVQQGHIYLKVNRVKDGFGAGSYTLVLQDTDQSNLREYEKFYIETIFVESKKIEWSDLSGGKYMYLMHDVYFKVFQEMQKRGYFFYETDFLNLTPEQARKKAGKNWIVSIGKAIINMGRGEERYLIQKGRLVLPRVMGFAKYLNIAEKDRIDFHIDQNNRELYVSEYAPYAIALGMSGDWDSELYGVTAHQVKPEQEKV